MKTIVVATNPYRHVDHLRRPCAACPADPKDPRYFDPAKDRNLEVRGWVGARLAGDPPLIRKDGGRGAGPADPSLRHDITFEFRFASFEIPETRFYLDRIREGALLPADEATAKAVKVPFRPVEQAREAARMESGSDQPVQWIDPPPAPIAKQLEAAAKKVVGETLQVFEEPEQVSDPEPKTGMAKKRRGYSKTNDAGTDES